MHLDITAQKVPWALTFTNVPTTHSPISFIIWIVCTSLDFPFFFSSSLLFFIIFFCFCLLCLTCIYYGATACATMGITDTMGCACCLHPYNLSTLLANKISPIPCPLYLILLSTFYFKFSVFFHSSVSSSFYF